MALNKSLSKPLGLRLPVAILDQYEAEAAETGIAVGTLIRRDIMRIRASESAPNSSTHAHVMGTRRVKDRRRKAAA
jgi:hypothetical protein